VARLPQAGFSGPAAGLTVSERHQKVFVLSERYRGDHHIRKAGGNRMKIVTRYGTMWPRNQEHLNLLDEVAGQGVYVLFDGSMPMYIGKGDIASRIRKAHRSKRRGQMWDHFSWYVIGNTKLIHDLEALMLRILPPNLRSLTRQGGNFISGQRIRRDKKHLEPIAITRKTPGRPPGWAPR
jgi:hypothetical protein